VVYFSSIKCFNYHIVNSKAIEAITAGGLILIVVAIRLIIIFIKLYETRSKTSDGVLNVIGEKLNIWEKKGIRTGIQMLRSF
jgi:hypothetical protein